VGGGRGSGCGSLGGWAVALWWAHASLCALLVPSMLRCVHCWCQAQCSTHRMCRDRCDSYWHQCGLCLASADDAQVSLHSLHCGVLQQQFSSSAVQARCDSCSSSHDKVASVDFQLACNLRWPQLQRSVSQYTQRDAVPRTHKGSSTTAWSVPKEPLLSTYDTNWHQQQSMRTATMPHVSWALASPLDPRLAHSSRTLHAPLCRTAQCHNCPACSNTRISRASGGMEMAILVTAGSSRRLTTCMAAASRRLVRSLEQRQPQPCLLGRSTGVLSVCKLAENVGV
jgi:hypothetical protein